MLENLSPTSRRCFDAAKQQAWRLGHSDLRTGHLLLGLLEKNGTLLDDLLEPYNLSAEQVARAVEAKLGPGNNTHPQRLKVSAKLKSALKQSAELAGGPVAPHHLMVALLTIDKDLAALFDQMGARSAALIQALQVRSQASAQNPSQSGQPTTPPVTRSDAKTPTLDRFGRDLTALAREKGRLPNIVGREQEMLGMMEVLCRQTKRNPVLVGPPGVGKTALVEGLAQRIAGGDVPPLLRGGRLVELSVSALVAGASRIGDFENRLQALIAEVKEAGNIILFIDEVHALMGAGGMFGLQDAATILKPALARGDITCIGATTTHDYRKYIEKDGALARRFQAVRVEEPSREITLEILATRRSRLETHFGIRIPEKRLEETYQLAKQYLKNHFFPDKAVDLIERAASRAMLTEGQGSTLTREHLLSVLADLTGIPLNEFASDEAVRYLQMEAHLSRRVLGQPHAVSTVASLIRLTKRRLDINPSRPDGVFLFVGPSGVGKTELAKALTEFLFGDEERLIRIDMSEYGEKHTVSRLIGSPPGYIGYDEEGQLTGQVRGRPFCVILLDEIDKAHPNVLNLFLQVFDDGRLTDAQGRTVAFSDATIIMTSNLVGDMWFERRIGFGASERDVSVTQEMALEELHKRLPDEFLSRVDEIVVFHPLETETVQQIAELKLRQIVSERFADRGITVAFDESVISHLVESGYDRRFGARFLERAIQRQVLEPLAEQTFQAGWQDVTHIAVCVENGSIVFQRGANL